MISRLLPPPQLTVLQVLPHLRPDDKDAVKVVAISQRMVFLKVSSKDGLSSRLYENMKDFQTASDGHWRHPSSPLSRRKPLS